MNERAIYLDNHSTTRVDPRVVEAMLPFFTETYGNAGSVTHEFGQIARDAVEDARERIAQAVGATAREIVFTSGATESNNLAIKGIAQRKGAGRIVTVATEHRSVLDPVARLARRGFSATLLSVHNAQRKDSGLVDVQVLENSLTSDVMLVSVMLANNEIGALQPLADIGKLCHSRGIALHCDATQAVGKIPLSLSDLGCDVVSFTAHKLHGPKGVGALYVRRDSTVRLQSQIDGGGQERGLRSGTLNTSAIIGFAKALELAVVEMPVESPRLCSLRDQLWRRIQEKIDGVALNGPALDREDWRLPNNLNVRFEGVNGEALMMRLRSIAVSSGAACSSAQPEPSHVLRALGLSLDETRASLRFGVGRFNDEAEIEFAASAVEQVVKELRAMRGE